MLTLSALFMLLSLHLFQFIGPDFIIEKLAEEIKAQADE